MHCDMYVIRVTSDHIFITKSSVYEPFVCPCVARIVHWKLCLVSPPTPFCIELCPCPKQKVRKLQIAYFCRCSRTFADYVHTLKVFCVCFWFAQFGDQHTTVFYMFLPYDGKSCSVLFSLQAMPEWWGGWAGTMYSVCGDMCGPSE